MPPFWVVAVATWASCIGLYVFATLRYRRQMAAIARRRATIEAEIDERRCQVAKAEQERQQAQWLDADGIKGLLEALGFTDVEIIGTYGGRPSKDLVNVTGQTDEEIIEALIHVTGHSENPDCA